MKTHRTNGKVKILLFLCNKFISLLGSWNEQYAHFIFFSINTSHFYYIFHAFIMIISFILIYTILTMKLFFKLSNIFVYVLFLYLMCALYTNWVPKEHLSWGTHFGKTFLNYSTWWMAVSFESDKQCNLNPGSRTDISGLSSLPISCPSLED